MGSYQNISKSPTTPPPSPLTSQSSQPPLPQKSNFPMLYYGIVVVATATLVLAIYHLIIVRWCTIQYHRHLQQENQLSRRRRNPTTPNNTMLPPSPVLSGGGSAVPSCKYKKGGEGSNKNELDYDTECSVCLSIFEDGEEVKRLPICDHCFHASCIDMWLYAHTHCPLCRAPVVEPPPQGSSSV